MNPWLLALTIFCAMFTQSLIGFGSGLIAMPILTAMLGIREASPLFALVAITAECLILLRYHRDLNLRAVRLLALTSIIGIPLGILLLRQVDDHLARVILGAFVTSYTLYALFAPRLPEIKNPRWAVGFGFLSGVLAGAYNTGGPPVVIYGTCRRWQPAEFRSNLQGLFMLNSAIVVSTHALSQHYTPAVLTAYLIALPAMLVGLLLGFRMDKLLNPAAFRKVVLLLLLVLGLGLIFIN